jgi:hypothetical protein
MTSVCVCVCVCVCYAVLSLLELTAEGEPMHEHANAFMRENNPTEKPSRNTAVANSINTIIALKLSPSMIVCNSSHTV